MSQVRASVWLGDARAGELRQDDGGYVVFLPDRRWQDSAARSVLGQWFEERPGKRQRGARPGDLPAFFSNLIPEGDLGLILRARLGIAPDDDLGLLIATGADLPGAVVVRAETESDQYSELPPGDTEEEEEVSNGPRLKFSLAGVQLKFSMLRSGDRFTFPGKDGRGDWIAKIAHADYAGLCENEFVTMEWARRSGFEVPHCELRTLGELVDVPHDGDPAMSVFVIKRYDRDGPARIHQEDLMQVLGFPNWPSTRKYNDATYEQLAFLLSGIIDDSAFDEILRRLTFVLATGNNDAHLKNWSIYYPDGISAKLTPLYDQTFAGQWSTLDKDLALNLGGTKPFASVDIRRFREFAVRCDRDADATAAEVQRLIEHFAMTWSMVISELSVPADYRRALQRHWTAVPVLAPHALLIG